MKWKLLAILVIFEAGAAGATGAAGASTPPAASSPPTAPATPSRGDASKHWSESLRSSVMGQCQEQIPDTSFCSCLTHQLESISPDPEQEFTEQDLEAGLARCQGQPMGQGQGSAQL